MRNNSAKRRFSAAGGMETTTSTSNRHYLNYFGQTMVSKRPQGHLYRLTLMQFLQPTDNKQSKHRGKDQHNK